MAFGPWITRRASKAQALGGALLVLALGSKPAAATCERPVYLTFDTGHMGVAPLVAEVLKRQQIKVTFFLADEATQTGGTSLDEVWAPWWRERVREGHLFGSHTADHLVWQADLPGGGFRVKPTAGPLAGKPQTLSPAQYCAQLQRSNDRFFAMTGKRLQPWFRAPAGRTSPALLAATKACGWQHVPWTPAGFLGDELSSQTHPNSALLQKALRDIRPGDILLAHLGIWSRQDPWAPAVLEPLITGLKAKGLCFATLAEHPRYRATAQAVHP